ncbi:hypothetical protein ABPG72_013121 [Tetrahymena utriculariae]
MGSQSSKLVNGQEMMQQSSGIIRNQYVNQSGNSIGSMTDTQQRGNFINTIFQWTNGANSVQLTGTFNNWVNPIPLEKVENNCFQVILKLRPGVYQYKYIVDGQWRFSPDDPTCNDENGNINNLIDTTNIERSISLIGQNNGSTKFLTMGSQNNSVNFIQTNARIMNSNGNVAMQQQQNTQNQQNIMGVNASNRANQQFQYQAQQQQLLHQFQYQNLQKQQQQQQPQQQYNVQNVFNQQQQNLQIFQQLGNNPQNISSNIIGQQQGGTIPQQEFQKMMQQGGQGQYANSFHPSSNISNMQAMYIRASQNSNFDKSQLLIKAHITQQNQTNFEVAFKDQAPVLPPHLLEVPTIKRRSAKYVSMWREKKLRPKSTAKSVFGGQDSVHNTNSMNIEDENTDTSMNGQQLTLNNTPEDDAEVLMHVFQPGHSITPVDHVTLNHIGIDNLNHHEKYNVYCITQRFKTKYTTYKFYTSKYDTQIII